MQSAASASSEEEESSAVHLLSAQVSYVEQEEELYKQCRPASPLKKVSLTMESAVDGADEDPPPPSSPPPPSPGTDGYVVASRDVAPSTRPLRAVEDDTLSGTGTRCPFSVFTKRPEDLRTTGAPSGVTPADHDHIVQPKKILEATAALERRLAASALNESGEVEVEKFLRKVGRSSRRFGAAVSPGGISGEIAVSEKDEDCSTVVVKTPKTPVMQPLAGGGETSSGFPTEERRVPAAGFPTAGGSVEGIRAGQPSPNGHAGSATTGGAPPPRTSCLGKPPLLNVKAPLIGGMMLSTAHGNVLRMRSQPTKVLGGDATVASAVLAGTGGPLAQQLVVAEVHSTRAASDRGLSRSRPPLPTPPFSAAVARRQFVPRGVSTLGEVGRVEKPGGLTTPEAGVSGDEHIRPSDDGEIHRRSVGYAGVVHEGHAAPSTKPLFNISALKSPQLPQRFTLSPRGPPAPISITPRGPPAESHPQHTTRHPRAADGNLTPRTTPNLTGRSLQPESSCAGETAAQGPAPPGNRYQSGTGCQEGQDAPSEIACRTSVRRHVGGSPNGASPADGAPRPPRPPGELFDQQLQLTKFQIASRLSGNVKFPRQQLSPVFGKQATPAAAAKAAGEANAGAPTTMIGSEVVVEKRSSFHRAIIPSTSVLGSFGPGDDAPLVCGDTSPLDRPPAQFIRARPAGISPTSALCSPFSSAAKSPYFSAAKSPYFPAAKSPFSAAKTSPLSTAKSPFSAAKSSPSAILQLARFTASKEANKQKDPLDDHDQRSEEKKKDAGQSAMERRVSASLAKAMQMGVAVRGSETEHEEEGRVLSSGASAVTFGLGSASSALTVSEAVGAADSPKEEGFLEARRSLVRGTLHFSVVRESGSSVSEVLRKQGSACPIVILIQGVQ